MTVLVKYQAARHALAVCKQVDEVKDIRDKAEAMRHYGHMANDRTLEVDATEIRIRAERRLGELLTGKKTTGELNRGAAEKGANAVVSNDRVQKPTLADAGISKDLSSRAQAIAAVPEAEFEKEVGEWRERVSAEGARVTTRLVEAGKKAQTADEGPTAGQMLDQLNAEIHNLQAEIDALLVTDKDKELNKQMVLLKHAVREKDQEMDKNARLMKERDKFMRWQSEVVRISKAGSPEKAMAWVKEKA